jgi:hypothetical protein
MFLWVRLVLESLETVYTVKDLHDIIAHMPSDLTALYTRILGRLCDVRQPKQSHSVSRILNWMSFSLRSLNKYELLHGITLSTNGTMLAASDIPTQRILELCKPLIEHRSDGVVTFVHFSVQEFVQGSAVRPQVLTYTKVPYF